MGFRGRTTAARRPLPPATPWHPLPAGPCYAAFGSLGLHGEAPGGASFQHRQGLGTRNDDVQALLSAAVPEDEFEQEGLPTPNGPFLCPPQFPRVDTLQPQTRQARQVVLSGVPKAYFPNLRPQGCWLGSFNAQA